MPRLRLSPQRLSATKPLHIGRIIIFCEGKTEKHYFEYFSDIIERTKYDDIEIILENAGGNAQAVLNTASEFMRDAENNRKYAAYGKYLVFDCDAPENIQSVIMKSREFELLVSNLLFETWLLMHFEDIDSAYSKRETYSRLTDHLHGEKYRKGHKGKTREILHCGDVAKAIDNAQKLDAKYAALGHSLYTSVGDMNPYSGVYTLVEQFMVAISRE